MHFKIVKSFFKLMIDNIHMIENMSLQMVLKWYNLFGFVRDICLFDM